MFLSSLYYLNYPDGEVGQRLGRITAVARSKNAFLLAMTLPLRVGYRLQRLAYRDSAASKKARILPQLSRRASLFDLAVPPICANILIDLSSSPAAMPITPWPASG